MNNPTFTQTYTNAIRRFQIIDNGVNLSVNTVSVTIDSLELHRRDYNVVPQIMPNGEEGLTAFSGVFLPTIDLPYTNCVNIDSTGYTVNNNFTQLYNQYHCAHIPLYSSTNNEMHTLFFGGIAQYYDSLGITVQDNNVPFVNNVIGAFIHSLLISAIKGTSLSLILSKGSPLQITKDGFRHNLFKSFLY